MGQGGFGVVYRAIRIVDDLPVAVKFIERRHVRDWGKVYRLKFILTSNYSKKFLYKLKLKFY